MLRFSTVKYLFLRLLNFDNIEILAVRPKNANL